MMPMLRGAEEHYADVKKMREFISEYKAVTLEQFDRYLYDKEPRVKKIIRKQLVSKDLMFIVDGMCSVKPDWQHYYDRAMVKALWVMLDFCEEIDHNSPQEYPTKIRFSKKGEVFDVCVAEKGTENEINVYYNNFVTEPRNYLVVVDDKEQMSRLKFNGIVAFCIVDEEGNVEYYREEEVK